MARELALFKISCQDGDARAQVMQFTEIFRGKTVDVSKRSVTVEITGTDDKIEAFENMVRPFGLIELIRTGEIAVAAAAASPNAPQRCCAKVAGHSMDQDARGNKASCDAVSVRVTRARGGGFALEEAAKERLRDRVERRSRTTRRAGTALAAITVPIPPSSTSVLPFCARRPDDRFACLEQPDRDGFVLAGLGQAACSRRAGRAVRRGGEPRPASWAREAFTDDPAEDPTRPPAAGPVFVGGFAFAHDGGSSPEWTGLPPACLVLPELALAQAGAARPA